MGKSAIRFLGAMTLAFAGFILLIVGMARLAWRLSPRDEAAIQKAAGFEASFRQNFERRGAVLAATAPASGPAGSLAAATDAISSRPLVVHHVAEWPAGNGRRFHEAPLLAARVEKGILPHVAGRLPEDPLVILPPHQNGPYGGSWPRMAQGSQSDIEVVMEARIANEGLLRWDAEGETIVPNLASRWEIGDGGKTFTFWLRKGVRWSDGEPFTSDDIKFFYEDVLKNNDLTPLPATEFISGGELATLETPDDFTIRFHFKEPRGLFLQQLASGLGAQLTRYPAHYMRQYHPRYAPQADLAAQAKKRGFVMWIQLFEDMRNWRNPKVPKLWAWVVKTPPPAIPVVFERNPYYWKVDGEGNQLPYIDRVTFEVFDGNTINLRAMNGELGMQERYLTLQYYPLLMENQQRGGYRVLTWRSSSGGLNILALNQNHKDPALRKVIQDRRFRFALSHAINRDEINRLIFYGLGTPRQLSPLPASTFYDPELEKSHLEYSPERANRFLDEMGLDKRDADGTRLLSNGKPLKLYIETWGWNDTPALELVADGWSDVGVKAEVKELARQLYTSRRNSALQDVAVHSSDNDMYPILEPVWYVPVSEGCFYAPNWGRWYVSHGKKGEEPPAEIKLGMDLYDQIESTVDEARQSELFKRILDLNRDNLWAIGTIGALPQIVVTRNDFRNVPEVAAYSWTFRSPSNTAPECYAIEPTK